MCWLLGICLRTAWCLKHQRQCSLRTACTHVAGTSCTDFSIIGKCERELGATYSYFLIWVAHRKILQEPVIVQENVTTFPRETLQRLLPEYEWTFGVVSPDFLGWPIRRDRQWCVYGAKSLIIQQSDQQCADDHMFYCPCLLIMLIELIDIDCCHVCVCW